MSTLNVANITDGSTTVATEYVVNGSAKAWVNFNGTGTIAVRDSLNVSSLTDNGTGLYTVNFISSMADINFCLALSGDNINGVGNSILNSTGSRSVSSFGLLLTDFANNLRDDDVVQSTLFGDLA